VDEKHSVKWTKPMKKRNLIVIISVVVVSVVLALWGAYLLYDLYRPRTFYDTGISNEEYIEITSQTLEAQKFLEKYPNATIYVDRSGALAVDYRVDNEMKNAYLRLRVFINWRTNQPSDKFIDCSGTYIRKNLLEYLEAEKCVE
jgi:flagellar basal body-associated protein FliL